MSHLSHVGLWMPGITGVGVGHASLHDVVAEEVAHAAHLLMPTKASSKSNAVDTSHKNTLPQSWCYFERQLKVTSGNMDCHAALEQHGMGTLPRFVVRGGRCAPSNALRLECPGAPPWQKTPGLPGMLVPPGTPRQALLGTLVPLGAPAPPGQPVPRAVALECWHCWE